MASGMARSHRGFAGTVQVLTRQGATGPADGDAVNGFDAGGRRPRTCDADA